MNFSETQKQIIVKLVRKAEESTKQMIKTYTRLKDAPEHKDKKDQTELTIKYLERELGDIQEIDRLIKPSGPERSFETVAQN